MIRKIACILLLIFLGGGLFPHGGYAMEQSFQIIRNEFKATTLGQRFLPQIDRLLPKLSEEQLDEIEYRIDDIYWEENISGEQESVLEYLNAAIEQERESRNIVHLSSSLSELEQKDVSASLMNIQTTVAGEIKNMVQDMNLNWSKLSKYEQKGNLSLDLNFDLKDIARVKSGFNMQDYTEKKDGFDSQLNAQIEAFIDATIQGENIKASGKSLVDFISKDGNMYLLAEKLELSGSGILQDSGFQNIIEKLSELAASKTYLKFSNTNSTETLKLLSQLQSGNIDSLIENAIQTPIFIATEKKASSYILTPTKHFCDVSKQALNIFDPFGGDTCSNTQYKNMLESMENSGISLQYTQRTNKNITIIIENETVSGKISIIWGDTGISSISGMIFDPENQKKNKASFSYFPKKSFEFLFQSEDDILAQSHGLLSETGSISEIHISGVLQDIGSINIDYNTPTLSIKLSAEDEAGKIACVGLGILKYDFLDLNTNCTINYPLLSTLFPGEESMQIDMKLQANTQANKNNIISSMTGMVGKTPIFSINVKHSSILTLNKNINISVPLKTIEMENVLESSY